ncbi:MAG: ABC-2 family transporter protein [Acidimicrobiales bacterium]
MRAVQHTLNLAWREAWAKRTNFWWSIAIMVINDLVWVLFWVIVMRRAGDIRGWSTQRVLLLQAILTTSSGVALGVLGSSRRIVELVSTGTLDSILSLPTPTLPQVLVRRIEPVHLGDTIFGVGLFIALGGLTLTRGGLFVLTTLCATVVLTSFLVMLGSITFFSERSEISESGFHALLLFSAYPIDIFSGVLKVSLHLIVPAAFVTGLPVEIVSEFSWTTLASLVGFTFAIAVAATAVFAAGLRRYTSGAGWTTS